MIALEQGLFALVEQSDFEAKVSALPLLTKMPRCLLFVCFRKQSVQAPWLCSTASLADDPKATKTFDAGRFPVVSYNHINLKLPFRRTNPNASYYNCFSNNPFYKKKFLPQRDLRGPSAQSIKSL